ncbi:MAG: PA14 domain-containing protein [Pseudomonadota bacterium]
MDVTNLISEWNQAGVQGGIPNDLPTVMTIDPGDDIQGAIKSAHDAGGGVIVLNEGTYRVSDTIYFEDDVVLRGADREDVVIESTIRSPHSGKPTFFFIDDKNSGIENMTLDYIVPGRSTDPHDYTSDPGGQKDLYSGHIRISANSNNNWIKDVNILNAGSDPVNVEGDHNTLTGNFVSGAFNKGGGDGYYRVKGDHNLMIDETVEGIRHLGIQNGAEHNVLTESVLTTDVNFHTGDAGSNLVEGNQINIPYEHVWFPIGTGAAKYGHLPPGPNNVLVNNQVSHEHDYRAITQDEGVVYTYPGFINGGERQRPTATDWEVPASGKFFDGWRPGEPDQGSAADAAIYLIDANSDEVIAELEGLMQVTPEAFGNLTIRADGPDGLDVGSVRMTLNDDHTQVENQQPYALFGNRGDDYFGGAALADGQNTLQLDFYSGANGNGELLHTQTETFELAARNTQFLAEFFNTSRLSELGDFDFSAPPDKTMLVDEISIDAGAGPIWEGGPGDNVAVRYTGEINIETAGEYLFRLTSDDGSKLFVDGVELIDNDKVQKATETSASVQLSAGTTDIEVLYFERTGEATLDLDWQLM